MAKDMCLYEDSSDVDEHDHFSFTFSPIYPDLLVEASDALEPPISSSPEAFSSPTSPISFECAYPLPETDYFAPTRPITPSVSLHLAREVKGFSAALNERLLLVASQNRDGDGSESHSDHEDSTPQPLFRVVKRAPSGFPSREGSLQFHKFRKVDPEGDGAPTEPSTPVPSRRWCIDVPIIAPPASYVPRLPLSAETEAKIRLGKFLEREGKERIRDCLLEIPQSLHSNEDSVFDSGSDFEGSELIRSASLRKLTSQEWEAALGIGQDLREEVIDWLTGVLPRHASGRYAPPKSEPCSANSSFSSTSSTTSCDLSNLYDQLASCPETRFHAVWMFLRYFWRLANTDQLDEFINHQATAACATQVQDDPDLAIWDTALACIALSVKFHRDFLIPLYPVQAHEFLALAPHEAYYGDLEATFHLFHPRTRHLTYLVY